MKVEVLLQTEGQAAVVVGEAEADTWPEMRKELPELLRKLADHTEQTEVSDDAAADG